MDSRPKGCLPHCGSRQRSRQSAASTEKSVVISTGVSERLLCPGSSASPWFTASCCRDGSLAVIPPLCVRPSAEESSSCGSAHPLSAGSAHTPIKISGKEKKGSCPIACATSPMLVGRDHSLRNESIYKDRVLRCVIHRGPELVSKSQKALSPAQSVEIWKKSSEISSTLDNQPFKTQRLDEVPNTSQWNQHRSSTSSRLCARTPKTTSMTPTLSLLSAPK